MGVWEGWDWSKFRGSAEALKYNRRDLPLLKRVVDQVKDYRAVVQAGGNLGIFPKYLAARFETVYTFEPEPSIFAKLAYNAPEQNIVKFQAALGHRRELVRVVQARRDGKLNVHEGVAHVVNGGVSTSGAEGVIPTLRIDDLGLPHCGLIYLDIEGYEFNAIRGAEETIGRYRPVIVCEVNRHMECYGFRRQDLMQHIQSMYDYRHAATMQSDEVFIPI